MDNFLHKYKIPKLNHDEINHLNSPTIPKEIAVVIKSPNNNNKKRPGPDGFSAELYQTFKEDLIPIFFKLFYKGTLPNSFYEGTIILIPKPHKDPRKRTSNQFSL